MKVIKRILLGLLALFLAASTIFAISYIVDDRKWTFSEIVENKSLSNLRLTIYFSNAGFVERGKISIDDLKSGYYDYKITVTSSSLRKHIDSLKELNTEPLIPYKQETNSDYRIYYVFTTKLGYKLYDVAMWSSDESIDVNGVSVKNSDIFYNVILPFLPEDAADELRTAVADIRQKTLEQNRQ